MTSPFIRVRSGVLATMLLATMLLGFAAAAASADDKADRQLLFDPTALGPPPGPLDSGPGLPTPRSAVRPSGETTGQARKRTTEVAPSSHAPPVHRRSGVSAGVGQTLGAHQASSASTASSNSFDRLKLGGFSIGVETETNFKSRSPTGQEASDASYEAPHNGLTVPFIGLSAKSPLH